MNPALPLKLRHRSAQQLEDSLGWTLGEYPDLDKGVWLFVYGLLAKEPPFKFIAKRPIVLAGWRRRFHLADPMNRGTSDKPGLTLGLEPGGTCAGIAYLISGYQAWDGLMAVWKQEMLLPFYAPQWLEQDGLRLLAMVTDSLSPALWRPLAVEETAAVIAAATGTQGSNREYLTDVIAAFSAYGIEDAYLSIINNTIAGT